MKTIKPSLSQFKFYIFLTFLLQIAIPRPVNAQVYHTNFLPGGDNHFYERALRKNVSYVRLNNDIIGALYDRRNPGTFTCFEANVDRNQVYVLWWNNLWLIGKSGLERFNRSYTIAAFTADNTKPQSGLDNPSAVKYCLDTR